MSRLLLIEDEASLAEVLRDRLVAEGYEVECCARGDAGEERARRGGFDLILLDVMLPGRDGFEVVRNLRAAGLEIPVLMLSARGELSDKVVGLKLGADDYLTKPFEMPELLARIEARLRRGGGTTFGSVEVDERAGVARKDGEEVELSAKEFQLLCFLVRHPGEVLTRDRLLSEVWNYDSPPPTRTVDVHVSGLRQKLEVDPRHPRHIRTVHGIGYKFLR